MAQWMDSMPDVEKMIAKSVQQLCNSNYQCLKETIKSIRRFTDPNSKFTLMSSFIGENKMSDVDLFSDCLLRMKQKCINKSSEKFLTSVALAEVKIEAAKTLRNQQIQSFSIDPLNKILEEKIESVKKVKVKLDRARTEYDTALEKLKAANEKNLYQLYNIMEEKKKAFETQAHIMAQWMDSMPNVEKMIAKSVQQLCNSNYQLRLLYSLNNYLIKHLNKERSTLL
ncbi:hypothetical protein T4C_8776 [Trichinella pseudospiralis]|uniref:BAR domain-containing protein n=1 Tax=Trichinella pseudospiralis TaxID=6337 RepID=A0A0V1KDH5_TRIPS|nr:hypothetical protein T4C_8776 [Trichinella pseudospiralis]